MSKKQEIIKKATQNLLEMFEAGEMPEAISLSIINRLQGDEIPSLNWSAGNRILMLSQGTSDARGYKQWQSAGRQVKKGSKAIYIFAPLVKKLEKDDATEEVAVVGFTTVPVFRYEDTEGDDLDRPDYAPLELPPLYHVAGSIGVRVEYTPFDGKTLGCFIPSKDLIQLSTEDSYVYFHELLHAVRHKFLRKGTKAEEEIIVDTGAVVICRLQGILGYEALNLDYIHNYAKTKNSQDLLKVLMRLLGEIENSILKTLELADIAVAV